jgi:hypothetical protein
MKIFSLWILVFLSSLQYAQVNIERYNNLNSLSGLMGNVSFYISSKTGNTDIQEFEIDGRVNYKGENFYSFLIAQGEYGWNKGKEYSNNALLHLRHLQDLEGVVDPELFAQINYDKSNLLLFRSLFGAGLRLSLISDTLANLDYGTSYMYEYEDIDLPETADHPSKTKHHRWSNYLSYSNNVSKNSRISVVIYAQPRLDNFTDVRFLSENHLKVGLTDKLSLSVSFSIRFDSKPPDGVKDTDTNTKVGFTFRF